MVKKERLERGHAMGKTLLGDKWDRLVQFLDRTHPDMADDVVEFAYGEIYPRDKLGLRERELISVVCLTLQHLEPQLKTHIHGALNVGVTEEELLELFMHIALYAGFPTALFGARVAREVFDEEKKTTNPVAPEAVTE